MIFRKTNHLYRKVIALEERVAMLETKQEILLEAIAELKKGGK